MTQVAIEDFVHIAQPYVGMVVDHVTLFMWVQQYLSSQSLQLQVAQYNSARTT